MIWLYGLNRQIEKEDPNGRFKWGIESTDDGDLRVVALHTDDNGSSEKITRVSRSYDVYAGSVRETSNFIKGIIEEMEASIKCT